MTNLAAHLHRSATERGHNPAIRFESVTLTWEQLYDEARAMAGRLRASGLSEGDRVALILPNVPAYPIAFFATLLAGGVVVPMNPLLKSGEINYFFSDSGATFALVWDDLVNEAERGAEGTHTRVIGSGPMGPAAGALSDGDALEGPAERGDEDTAVILYTSGTTGRPKGAELTHANLSLNSQRATSSVMVLTEEDVVMGCLPLFHVFGLVCGLLASSVVGAQLTLIPRFDPAKALEVIERDKVTVFQGVPTMYAAILNHPNADSTDASSLRVCCSGGSAMPVEVMRTFEAKFGCIILEGYGLSETSPIASFNMPHIERKPGTIGIAIPGCEMKLINDDGTDAAAGAVGEIAIRGDNVMKGYWGKPEETQAAIPDGWLRTGDMATVDSDGYFTIVDRKKDMINRGGMNVYPREVEECLYTHPDVLEVAVVSVPDDLMGEEIGAAVALRPGSSASAEDLQAFTKERIAAYKYPRHIWFVSELPKGPTGKILRREVRQPSA